jgi:membrane-associated phospholipid phosphatase
MNITQISDFGDQALVFPLAAGVGLIFALSGWRRGAWAWTTTMGATLCGILLLKLCFFACGPLAPGAQFQNPSGHTAAAAAVYGGLFTTVVGSLWDIQRWSIVCAVALALPVSVVIGLSRLVLDLHSVTEVISGGAIGVAGAVSFVAWAGPPSRRIQASPVVFLVVALVTLLHGTRMPAEEAIKHVAANLMSLFRGA